jgi:hypothetical protein
MKPVEVVSIFDLSLPRGRDAAVADWRGFATFRPGEMSKAGPSVLVLDNKPGAWWTWRDDLLTSRRIRPLGCHFLRDIEIAGVGFPFSEGRYIREYAHTSDVGQQWLNSADMPENPRRDPPTTRVAIDSPVLLVCGPGFPVFGHWLLDFLPRVAIAKGVLGDRFAELTIVLPDDTPDFVRDMLGFFCGVSADQIRTFSRRHEVLVCSRACLPSFVHDGDYALHSFTRTFYEGFKAPRYQPRNGPWPAIGRFLRNLRGDFRTSPVNQTAARARKRICLSRRTYETSTRSAWRVFETREAFERMAVARGYEIVQPERLGFAEQIQLFQSADTIIGEHGSGMHGALFAEPGTVVATFPPLNGIQLRIGAEFGHTNVSLARAAVRTDPDGIIRFSVAEDDLRSMLAMVDQVRSGRLSPGAA